MPQQTRAATAESIRHLFFNKLTQGMHNHAVPFLNPGSNGGTGHAQGLVRQTGELPALPTGQSHGPDSRSARHFSGAAYIRGVSAGGNGQQNVTGAAQRLNLLGIHLRVVVIVGNGGQNGGVRGERDGRVGAAFTLTVLFSFSKVMNVGCRRQRRPASR